MDSGVCVLPSPRNGTKGIGQVAMPRCAGEAPMQRDADLVHGLVVDLQRANPLGHYRHRIDMPALARHPHPVAGLDAFLIGQHLAYLDELLGLGNGVEPAMLAPEVEVLGQPVRGRRIGNSSCVPRVSHTESKMRPAGLLTTFLFCGCSGLMPIGVSNGS